ncbi:hypothetical protein M427DRAFT_53200 [Gonapodya prolifera JEL478]|uniref:Methyltransferase domain-containing protein n=1 Tax=Gonapodya prolifera (strain JEL478) TaxID=1344416 RepID=A0A139AR69_GONPJ|nr:hypothetical protein M427DRAFT_53200 [Gonapodya prolifera JEL478]|eukprot:KXS19247.1 hypothetical protein M427DRAFT_53200 [Gonapodya prolifera JEL478]
MQHRCATIFLAALVGASVVFSVVYIQSPQHRKIQSHKHDTNHDIFDQSIIWDTNTALRALLYKLNRNTYTCERMFSLGGSASGHMGDGNWPICFDGWEEYIPSGPNDPPWHHFQVRFDDNGQRTPLQRPLSRRSTAGKFYRPSGVHLERIKRNRGPNRQPEPLARPFEGQKQDQDEMTIIEGAVASQEELGNNPSCAMYGFGVDWDFTWEDEFHSITGCETHSFDPSLGMESHYRGRNQWFWNIGLSHTTTTTVGTTLRTKQVSDWAVFTVADTIRMLNHSYLSVVKVDVEGFEWDALARAFKDGAMDRVEQVLLEVHMWKPNFRTWSPEETLDVLGKDFVQKIAPESAGHEQVVRGILGWLQLLDEFERHGFLQYYHHTNPMSTMERWGDDLDVNNVPCCFEVAFVRHPTRVQ